MAAVVAANLFTAAATFLSTACELDILVAMVSEIVPVKYREGGRGTACSFDGQQSPVAELESPL